MTKATADDLANLFFERGDTTPDVCFQCHMEVVATFDVRTVQLEQSGVQAEDVLVAVCPTCHDITSIPAQSEPRLREARERMVEERLESRVTHAADDAFRAIAAALHTPPSVLRSKLLTYYLRQLRREPALLERVSHYAHGTLSRGLRTQRFTARIQHADIGPVQVLMPRYGINQSDLAIGIISLAASDLLVDGAHPRANELRSIASAL